MKEIREMKEKSSLKHETGVAKEESDMAAALRIQKIWRGYTTRRQIRKRRIEEMLLLGLPEKIMLKKLNTSKQ